MHTYGLHTFVPGTLIDSCPGFRRWRVLYYNYLIKQINLFLWNASYLFGTQIEVKDFSLNRGL